MNILWWLGSVSQHQNLYSAEVLSSLLHIHINMYCTLEAL